VSIALAMIVRDEAKTIVRCLESVRGLVDSYVIVDTGSTDYTKDLIYACELPGELHEREWVSFGHNRTELMQLAYGHADWLLLLDADHTVTHNGPPELNLAADSYMLRHADEPEYWVKRLVAGDKSWHFVGATHEFIATDEAERPAQRLDTITVHHHGDGGHRPEKFERDLELLRDEHEREPENARTVFYLANTLRDLGQTEEAIDKYLLRTHMGGWDEEHYCALYEAGRLADDIEMLLEAWSFRPSRAEPLYEIAWRMRRRTYWAAAFMVAERGHRIPMTGDALFVHRWVYEWGCEFELSIAAWHVGEIEQARESSDRLLECATLPPQYREQVIENREYL
jgi:tetratricopeptide (TPR) repeat protein